MRVTPDQMSAAASYIAREWGDYGYRITNIESPTYLVSAFYVRHSDGSEFVILADRWGNCREVHDGQQQRTDAEFIAEMARDMHADATDSISS